MKYQKEDINQKSIQNIKMFYQSRQAVIKLFNDYSSLASEAKYKLKNGEGHLSELAMRLKICPKQMLQRFPIALAQLKAGNTNENLLSEITRVTYSLYLEKWIIKKVYNKIANSIQS